MYIEEYINLGLTVISIENVADCPILSNLQEKEGPIVKNLMWRTGISQ
jgi:hypothetical protein